MELGDDEAVLLGWSADSEAGGNGQAPYVVNLDEGLAGGVRERARACLPCRQLKKKCEAERPCRSCVARRCPEECVDSDKNSACYQCRSRRLRCDRQRPCSRCVQRGVPGACSVVPPPELACAPSSGHQGSGKRVKTETKGSLPGDGSPRTSGKRRKPADGSSQLEPGLPQSAALALAPVPARQAHGLAWQVVPHVQRPLPFKAGPHRFDIPVHAGKYSDVPKLSPLLKRFYEIGFDVRQIQTILNNLPASVAKELTTACRTLEQLAATRLRAITAPSAPGAEGQQASLDMVMDPKL